MAADSGWDAVNAEEMGRAQNALQIWLTGIASCSLLPGTGRQFPRAGRLIRHAALAAFS